MSTFHHAARWWLGPHPTWSRRSPLGSPGRRAARSLDASAARPRPRSARPIPDLTRRTPERTHRTGRGGRDRVPRRWLIGQAREPFEELVVEPSVRRERTPSMDRPHAGEIGQATPSLLDQDRRCRQIPRAQVALDHRLRRALGDQRVAPEVTEAAVAPRIVDQVGEPGSLAALRDVGLRAIQDLGVGDRAHHGDRDRPRRRARPALPVDRPRATPPGREPALAQGRRGKDPDLELTVAFHCQEHPEQGHAAHEVVGAVDGIDVPAGRGIALFRAVLLPDQPMVGERVGQPFADHLLDGPISLRDERPIGLGLDDQVASEARSRELVGHVRARQGDLEPAAELRL
jgi:hypothetical protein